MHQDTSFIMHTEVVTVNGVYRLGIRSGYVFMMFVDGEQKPRITIGNDQEVDALWDIERGIGVCPYLDTYMVANCCLHSSSPIEVMLFRMIPVTVRAGV